MAVCMEPIKKPEQIHCALCVNQALKFQITTAVDCCFHFFLSHLAQTHRKKGFWNSMVKESIVLTKNYAHQQKFHQCLSYMQLFWDETCCGPVLLSIFLDPSNDFYEKPTDNYPEYHELFGVLQTWYRCLSNYFLIVKKWCKCEAVNSSTPNTLP